ncbi:MAG TPA: hypothetical protein VJP80_02175 [Candidatus Saccharimonadales bacterium]|nr:hypothetical protein [Candidatus Saccharimonadales bacterium]
MSNTPFSRELTKAGTYEDHALYPVTFWLPQSMRNWLAEAEAATCTEVNDVMLLHTGISLAVRRHIAEKVGGQAVLLDEAGMAHELPARQEAFAMTDEAIALTMATRPLARAYLEYMDHYDYADDAFADGVRILMRAAGAHAVGMGVVCEGVEDRVLFSRAMLPIHNLPDCSREA